MQYLENPNEKVEIVVFGHTHVPAYLKTTGGSYYINSGTWIDHNVDYSDAPRTFVVITTGDKDTATLNCYMEDGSIKDISNTISK
jgi:predicted phosphodiesterase